MTGEITAKLVEIIQTCAKNNIKTVFTQDGDKDNSINETIEEDERVVQIQIGDPNSDELLELLSNFLQNSF